MIVSTDVTFPRNDKCFLVIQKKRIKIINVNCDNLIIHKFHSYI